MTLEERTVALAEAVGAEIKEVRSEMASISGGGGSSNVVISATEPNVTIDTLWIEKRPDGSFSFWLKEI